MKRAKANATASPRCAIYVLLFDLDLVRNRRASLTPHLGVQLRKRKSAEVWVTFGRLLVHDKFDVLQ